MLGLRGHGDDVRATLEAAGFVNIGLAVESPQLLFAMRGDDPQVYEYNEEDILDTISEQRDATASMYPVFPS